MKTIWKFQIGFDQQSGVMMPRGAEILKVDASDYDRNHSRVGHIRVGLPNAYVWAIVDSEAPEVLRKIDVHGTGYELSDSLGKHNYIGSVQILSGRLVYHFFDMGEVQ